MNLLGILTVATAVFSETLPFLPAFEGNGLVHGAMRAFRNRGKLEDFIGKDIDGNGIIGERGPNSVLYSFESNDRVILVSIDVRKLVR